MGVFFDAILVDICLWISCIHPYTTLIISFSVCYYLESMQCNNV